MTVINVSDLRKDYGGVLGVDGLTFSVEEGEIFGFLGPNGAGKTTTIRTLLGLISPTTGAVSVLGADVQKERELVKEKHRIGYLPADLEFDSKVTGEKVLDYHASVKGDSRRDELLEVFTPPLARPIREYSTGNKRMLGLVQAFMHDPDLVIMDEPTSGLDPLKQEKFNEFIDQESRRGTSIFFSSHVLSEVRRVCDRVGILRDGDLVALEDIDELLNRGGKRVRIHSRNTLDATLESLDGVYDIVEFEEGVQFTYTGEYPTLLQEFGKHNVIDIDISEPALEDIFMHYYGTPSAETDREVVTNA